MLTFAMALVAVLLFVFATSESTGSKGTAAALLVLSFMLRFVFDVHFFDSTPDQRLPRNNSCDLFQGKRLHRMVIGTYVTSVPIRTIWAFSQCLYEFRERTLWNVVASGV